MKKWRSGFQQAGMNIKQIILFVFLTILLIVLSYGLLDVIDRHFSYKLIITLGLLVIADIVTMTSVFRQHIKSSNHRGS